MPSVDAPATRCAATGDAAGAHHRVRSPKRRELLDRIAGPRRGHLRTRNVELGRDLRHRLRHHLRRPLGRRAPVLGRELRWCASASGRPRGARERGADERNELPPPHSITSSARRSNTSGIVRPSALAVLRLMTSSNLVGA